MKLMKNVEKKVGPSLFLILLIAAGYAMSKVSARPSILAADLGAPIETRNVGETFNVTIYIHDIQLFYAWQTKLYFNTAFLNVTGATYPPGHVFEGVLMIPVEPVFDNALGSVLFGLSMMGDGCANVTGQGVLCNLEFYAKAIGISYLNFSTPYGVDTFLWDVNLELIDAAVINGSLNVVPEFNPSTLILLFAFAAMIATVVAKSLSRKVHYTL